MAEQPSLVLSAQQYPYPQQPVPQKKADLLLVFIGGFGDEISGIMAHSSRLLPRLADAEARAYYHWHGSCPTDPSRGLQSIIADVTAFRQQNPKADVVLVGHSMGAAMALNLAASLSVSPEQGRVVLLTLDPTDRAVQPQRPASVSWWGNAYVTQSQSGRDFLFELGGRWNHCAEADINLRFDGRQKDEYGQAYIHDNAYSLLMSRGGSQPQSLHELLREFLQTDNSQQSQ